METTYIEHKGQKYEVKEPTIEAWKNVMIYKDLLDEEEMYVKMISEVTGLSMKEVKSSDALEIRIAGDKLWRYLNQESKKLFTTIEHNGITYNLVDLNKVSFGQFVDIDTFMKKDEPYKVANLNELAAYLYCEDGVEYGNSDIKKRIEDFKDLPVKYIEAAIFFLLSLAKGLQELTTLYSKSPVMWWMMRVRIAWASFGDGIKQLVSSQKTKFGKLIVLLTFPLWLVLITFLSLWTLIVSKKKK
jgi:hemin uptake protein HemP